MSAVIIRAHRSNSTAWVELIAHAPCLPPMLILGDLTNGPFTVLEKGFPPVTNSVDPFSRVLLPSAFCLVGRSMVAGLTVNVTMSWRSCIFWLEPQSSSLVCVWKSSSGLNTVNMLSYYVIVSAELKSDCVNLSTISSRRWCHSVWHVHSSVGSCTHTQAVEFDMVSAAEWDEQS